MYSRFLDSSSSSDEACAVLRRATRVFLSKSPSLHIELAALEEAAGRVDKARIVLSSLRAKFPSHLEAAVRAAALERRQNNWNASSEVLDELESNLSAASVSSSSSSDNDNALLWLSLYRAHLSPSREAYRRVADRFASRVSVWNACVQFEVRHSLEAAAAGGGDDLTQRVAPLYECALANLTEHDDDDDRVLVLEQWLELLYDRSADMTAIRDVQRRLNKAKATVMVEQKAAEEAAPDNRNHNDNDERRGLKRPLEIRVNHEDDGDEEE
jgi:hypothetical protein